MSSRLLRKAQKAFRLLEEKLARPVIGKAATLAAPFLTKQPSSAAIFSDKNYQLFFGYYDVTPFSADSKKLLACRVPTDHISTHLSHAEMEVGYFGLNDKEPFFVTLGTTSTWNWQQGCRVQWLDSDRIIYNNFIDGSYVSVVTKLNTKEENIIDFPVYSLASNGRNVLTLNFSRLHRLRPGYGYHNRSDETIDLAAPENDGLWLADLETREKKLLVSLKTMAEYDPHPGMEDKIHYINHLDFSPDGNIICWTHLWVDERGKKKARLFVCNKDGSNIRCLNNTGKVSHSCWYQNKLMVYSRAPDEKLYYIIYDLQNGRQVIYGADHLKEDGHPSWIEGQKILTDTYPDILRRQHLMIYDDEKSDLKKIGSFNTPVDFTGELRCDLHPRLSTDKKMACVDIVQDRKRAICVFPINQ